MGLFSSALGCLFIWWIICYIDKKAKKSAERKVKQEELEEYLRIAKYFFNRNSCPDPRTSTNEQIKEYIINYKRTHNEEEEEIDIISNYYHVSRKIGYPLEHRVGAQSLYE
ncbi:MAG: hypothetical protein RR277_08170 [Rikenellaceae bacterium]